MTMMTSDSNGESGNIHRPSQTDVIFVAMYALENGLLEILGAEDGLLEILGTLSSIRNTGHCHENGVCQEPDECPTERSRVRYELQLADGCQSERSRVCSELQPAKGCQSERSRV